MVLMLTNTFAKPIEIVGVTRLMARFDYFSGNRAPQADNNFLTAWVIYADKHN